MAFLMIILVIISGSCQTRPTLAPKVPQAGPKYLQAHYQGSENSRQMPKVKGKTGYLLIDMKTGEVKASKNASDAFTPGSVLKIFTGFYALKTLGEDYRFETYLKFDGKKVCLVGGGDPWLLSSHLMSMAQELKRIENPKGHLSLVYDDSLLSNSQEIDSEQEDFFPYNPGVSALSSEFNRFELSILKNPSDSNSFLAQGRPDMFYDNLAFAKTDREDDEDFSYDPAKEAWFLPTDQNLSGQSYDLPVKNPSLATAKLFRHLAAMNGINFEEKIEKADCGSDQKMKTLASHQGPMLIDLTDKMFEYSNNLMAELLLLGSIHKENGKQSLSASAEIMLSWFKKHYPSINWKKAFFKNGSGLSHQTKITPEQLTKILQDAYQSSFKRQNFASLFPISGMKGTMLHRMLTPQDAFRVWAKTGSMDGVSSLAGYLFPQSGRQMAFVIFMQNNEGSEEKNDIREWKRQAKNAQDILLQKWLRTF